MGTGDPFSLVGSAVIYDATEDPVSPPRLPDDDGPEAPTVDSGGGPQVRAADNRSRP